MCRGTLIAQKHIYMEGDVKVEIDINEGGVVIGEGPATPVPLEPQKNLPHVVFFLPIGCTGCVYLRPLQSNCTKLVFILFKELYYII